MNIWIDFANSPHPLLFAPVVRRLEQLGHRAQLTARDHAQTLQLARARFPGVEVLGGESPSQRGAKARTLAIRAGALTRWARSEKPDVALSHNSYAQLLAARALRIPAVTAMDFEHQPANHLAFRLANTVLLPAAIAPADVRRQGATPRKTRFYDGLKEELYLGDFEPDSDVLESAGLHRGAGVVLVVMRTPPSRALYHRFENPLFHDVLRELGRQAQVMCVVLARHPEQRRAIAAMAPTNICLPERALDSRSLMWTADLVLGAGGTMTREAALLGVPTFSLFAGPMPAVDRWLEERGALRVLKDVSELVPVRRRRFEPRDPRVIRDRGERLVDFFVAAVTAAPRSRFSATRRTAHAHG
jgi:uncharacterized protein